MVDGCLSGQPSKTAAKPVPSSCSVAASSHAEGTANVARLVCTAQVSANASTMKIIDLFIDFLIYCNDSKELWEKVRQIKGKARTGSRPMHATVQQLNQHFATISTDLHYFPPPMKATANTMAPQSHFTEYSIFRALDTIKPTASGLDNLPYWFFKIAAPFISMPLSYLFHLSLFQSTVPAQWKTSSITPVPKTGNLRHLLTTGLSLFWLELWKNKLLEPFSILFLPIQITHTCSKTSLLFVPLAQPPLHSSTFFTHLSSSCKTMTMSML